MIPTVAAAIATDASQWLNLWVDRVTPGNWGCCGTERPVGGKLGATVGFARPRATPDTTRLAAAVSLKPTRSM